MNTNKKKKKHQRIEQIEKNINDPDESGEHELKMEQRIKRIHSSTPFFLFFIRVICVIR